MQEVGVQVEAPDNKVGMDNNRMHTTNNQVMAVMDNNSMGSNHLNNNQPMGSRSHNSRNMLFSLNNSMGSNRLNNNHRRMDISNHSNQLMDSRSHKLNHNSQPTDTNSQRRWQYLLLWQYQQQCPLLGKQLLLQMVRRTITTRGQEP